jgi:hypothetical protein
VTFGGAFDPILKLAVSLRQLLGYDVAAANCPAVDDVRGKRDSLALAKFCGLPLNGSEVLGVCFSFSGIFDDIER